jgi:tRNA threonylcarbamoyladenosine biosynthesis protein TsaB
MIDHPNLSSATDSNILLAIDTTTTELCISLYAQGRVYQYCHPSKKHANAFSECIEYLLQQAQVSCAQLTHLVVNTGPGSFTGLRVGIAGAQGLAHGLDIPVYTITNSQIHAFAAHKHGETGYIACLLDAKLAQVYFAVFRYQAQALPILVSPDTVRSPENLPSTMPYDTLYCCGNGRQAYFEKLTTKWQQVPQVASPLDVAPTTQLCKHIDTFFGQDANWHGASIATVMLVMCLLPNITNPILPLSSAQVRPNYVRHQVANKPSQRD